MGGSTTAYTWDVNGGLPVVLQDGTYTYVYGLGLISQTDNSGNQDYFLGNGLGSTEALVDGAGSVVATYKYDVYGAVRSSSGSGNTEYRFTGQQDDADIGYTYPRARYYDQATGRFLSKDPFPGVTTSPISQHHYVYAADSPAYYSDPSGEVLPIILFLGGVVVGELVYAVTHPEQARQGMADPVELAAYSLGTGVLFVGGGIALETAGGVAALAMAGQRLLDWGRGLASSCSRVAEAAPGIDSKFAAQLERQLAKDGPRSILRSLRSLERQLAEHKTKVAGLQYKTGVEREIRTLERQVETVKHFIREKGIQ